MRIGLIESVNDVRSGSVVKEYHYQPCFLKVAFFYISAACLLSDNETFVGSLSKKILKQSHITHEKISRPYQSDNNDTMTRNCQNLINQSLHQSAKPPNYQILQLYDIHIYIVHAYIVHIYIYTYIVHIYINLLRCIVAGKENSWPRENYVSTNSSSTANVQGFSCHHLSTGKKFKN